MTTFFDGWPDVPMPWPFPRLVLRVVFAVWACCDASGQATQKSAMLAWSDPAYQMATVASPNGTIYTIRQAPGACGATSVFAIIGSLPSTSPVNTATPTLFQFQVNGLNPGTYCFNVTPTDPGQAESAPSNNAQGTVPSTTPPPTTRQTINDLTVRIF